MCDRGFKPRSDRELRATAVGIITEDVAESQSTVILTEFIQTSANSTGCCPDSADWISHRIEAEIEHRHRPSASPVKCARIDLADWPIA